MGVQKKKNALLLAVCKPEAIGGQAACARMLLKHFHDVNWHWLSFPLPKQYGAFIRSVFSLKISLQSVSICLTKKIDVVHLLTACGRSALFEKLIIARILKLTGVKVILNFQGAFDHYYESFSMKDQHRVQKLLEKIDIVLCLHSGIEKYLIDKKIVPANKLKVIPNAVEIGPLPLRIKNADGKFHLLYLGWLVTNKGLFTLVQAAGLLKKNSLQNFSVDITGPEIEEGIINKLKQEAERLDVAGHIHFHPPVFGEEKRKMFSQADLFVFPTRMEGFPFVLLEAMEASMPVLTTDIAPMNLLVEEGRTGLLFEKDNAADLAGKILNAMNDEGKREELGRNAREHIASHYAVEQIIEKYDALYAHLLK